MKATDTYSFIKKAKLIHGDTYDYSLVEYTRSRFKVKIICKKHGLFEQRANAHIMGSGCNKCGDENTSKIRTETNDIFIEKAKLVHGDRYKYDLVDYKKSNYKVFIKCSIHGVFKQRPNDHLMGKGCFKCSTIGKHIRGKNNPTGWGCDSWEKSALKSKYFDSFKVYVIKCWNDTEEFYKIGRTFRKVKKRFYAKEVMPYNYEIVKVILFKTAKESFDYETKLKYKNKDNFHTPLLFFKGMHECFYKINE